MGLLGSRRRFPESVLLKGFGGVGGAPGSEGNFPVLTRKLGRLLKTIFWASLSWGSQDSKPWLVPAEGPSGLGGVSPQGLEVLGGGLS